MGEKRNIRKYRHTVLWREDESDIVFWNYMPSLHMDLETAKELVESRLDYCDHQSNYAVIDITNVKSSTKEARDFMNSNEGGLKGILAGAFLANNVVSTLLVNIYLKVNTPLVPARFFTKKDEAVEWLLRIRNDQRSKT